MDESATTTPMMKQYRRVKSQLPPGTLLFFRLGDFYEMFFEDAIEASSLLDITLTKRNGTPMCGVPHHAADNYLARLIRAGKKVAVCDQLEDPATAKGIVKRDITNIVTPGTVTVESVLEAKRNNYLAAVLPDGKGAYGLALLDMSTGAFIVERNETAETLRENIRRYAPAECLVPAGEDGVSVVPQAVIGEGILTTALDSWIFDYDAAHDLLIRHFGVHSLAGFGIEGRRELAGAAGAALYYVREQLRRDVVHVVTIRLGNPSDHMVIDETTCANLDLMPSAGRLPGDSRFSLLRVLDCTVTAMGGRLVRDWLMRPLADASKICARLDAVEEMVKDRGLQQTVRDRLQKVKDMERLAARLGSGGNGRDLVGLSQSLAELPETRKVLEGSKSQLLRELAGRITPLPDLVSLIGKAIVDDPPLPVKEGGIIREGYSRDLDELRDAAKCGRNWLTEYEARERERTGIKTIKVRYNKVFGYFIEVSKGQLANVPPEYIRKQTVVNGERFITPEIKEYEQKILGAQERSVQLEYELFNEVREEVVGHIAVIQSSADAVGRADVLAGFANRAVLSRYVRPDINDSRSIDIKEGRHPVVEECIENERFVPNDLCVDCDNNQLLIITGPNMAGKSTYIRQSALLVIMAQAGSFVPAREAHIGIVDRVFSRVGASDDLARGRSTFMVEMQETANILNNATPRSLLILDEIGRGTSTFDGISIAWAVAEFLHNSPRAKARTLFATHFHELTDLAMTMPGIKNYNVLVKEKADSVVFLRRIVPGPADKSYGIQVARLAGLPAEVVDRAREILLNLEDGEFGEQGKPRIAQRRRRDGRDPSQMAFQLET